MLDQTDWMIIECLQQHARMSWKEIGEKVHLTGQAVANRILRLEEIGIIERYTVKLNLEKMGKPILAFITVFMKSHHHTPFLDFVQKDQRIIEAHRVSGEGCYWLKVSLSSQTELNQLLDQILKYGNYRLNLSIGALK